MRPGDAVTAGRDPQRRAARSSRCSSPRRRRRPRRGDASAAAPEPTERREAGGPGGAADRRSWRSSTGTTAAGGVVITAGAAATARWAARASLPRAEGSSQVDRQAVQTPQEFERAVQARSRGRSSRSRWRPRAARTASSTSACRAERRRRRGGPVGAAPGAAPGPRRSPSCGARRLASLTPLRALVYICTSIPGESGGTGRRTRLRIRWPRPWGFESPLSHLSLHVHEATVIPDGFRYAAS